MDVWGEGIQSVRPSTYAAHFNSSINAHLTHPSINPFFHDPSIHPSIHPQLFLPNPVISLRSRTLNQFSWIRFLLLMPLFHCIDLLVSPFLGFGQVRTVS